MAKSPGARLTQGSEFSCQTDRFTSLLFIGIEMNRLQANEKIGSHTVRTLPGDFVHINSLDYHS